jgi:hypothetical protein
MTLTDTTLHTATFDDAMTSVRDHGFALVEGVLAPGHVDELRTKLFAAADEADARGITIRFPGMKQQSRRVYYLPNYDPVFTELAQHPFALASIEALLPGEFIIGNLGANMLSFGSGPQDLHRDQGDKLALVRGPSPDPPLGINVGWVIDDMTAANGATVVIPGSHRWDNDRVPTDDDETLSVVAPAGSALVIDSRIWHGAGDNTTPGAERSFIFGLYFQAWVRPHCHWNVGLWPEVAAALSPDMRRRLGLDHGYADIY